MKNFTFMALSAIFFASCARVPVPAHTSDSITEFKNRADAGDTAFCRVSATVVSIADYDNGRFYLYDGEDYLKVYGMRGFRQEGIEVGDAVTLLARPHIYHGETEACDAACVSVRRGSCPGFASDVADVSWPELPETSVGDGCVFIHHPSSSGGRNYSVYYDTLARIARWVAYPLYLSDLTDGMRTDAYAYDPLIPRGSQASIGNKSFTSGSGGSFVRGHLVPSADRLGLRDNLDVFMACNIVPENSGLNSGAWASLEAYCRELAVHCDTLYVVAGTDTRESADYVRDNAGHRVRVPAALFKAVVVFSEKNGYSGFGLYFPNKKGNPSKISPDMFMSISELEDKLGKNGYLYKNISL